MMKKQKNCNTVFVLLFVRESDIGFSHRSGSLRGVRWPRSFIENGKFFFFFLNIIIIFTFDLKTISNILYRVKKIVVYKYLKF